MSHKLKKQANCDIAYIPSIYTKNMTFEGKMKVMFLFFRVTAPFNGGVSKVLEITANDC